ncbi:MAG: SPFH domain-containing protein [Candidatus Hydrogenedentota bacterium]
MQDYNKKAFILFCISISAVLTVLKFVLFYVSSSLALLAEAWHSFADIGTSVIALIAVIFDEISRVPPPPDKKPSFIRKLVNTFSVRDPELQASVLIGFILLIVSINLFFSIVYRKEVIINYSLPVGSVIIIFSVFSYFLYKLKLSIADKTGSRIIYADAIHSASDTVTVFVTGLSIILYNIGINIDRFLGLGISAIIFLLAIELIVKSLLCVKKESKDILFKGSVHSVFHFLLFQNLINSLLKRTDATLIYSIIKNRYLRYSFIIIVIIILCYSSLFIVPPDSCAICERFGKPLQSEPGKLLQPGLHIKIPFIDQIRLLDNKKVRKIDIGNIATRFLVWNRTHREEIHFLSGDDQFLDPFITVHYSITDPYRYLYACSNSEIVLKRLMTSILTHNFISYDFYAAAIDFRESLEVYKTLLQENIDKLNLGIKVESVLAKDIHPPVVIIDSYDRVIASMQEKEQLINEGLSYRNSRIPEANAERVKLVESGYSYKFKRVSESRGVSNAFVDRVSGLSSHRNDIKFSLILENVSELLNDKKVYIIDPEAKTIGLWRNVISFSEYTEDKSNE